MNLVGYYPNRKRFKYERHTYQRFLLVLKGNFSFHFLLLYYPPLAFQKCNVDPLVASSLTLSLCLLFFVATASRNLICFPSSNAMGFTKLKG